MAVTGDILMFLEDEAPALARAYARLGQSKRLSHGAGVTFLMPDKGAREALAKEFAGAKGDVKKSCAFTAKLLGLIVPASVPPGQLKGMSQIVTARRHVLKVEKAGGGVKIGGVVADLCKSHIFPACAPDGTPAGTDGQKYFVYEFKGAVPAGEPSELRIRDLLEGAAASAVAGGGESSAAADAFAVSALRSIAATGGAPAHTAALWNAIVSGRGETEGGARYNAALAVLSPDAGVSGGMGTYALATCGGAMMEALGGGLPWGAISARASGGAAEGGLDVATSLASLARAQSTELHGGAPGAVREAMQQLVVGQVDAAASGGADGALDFSPVGQAQQAQGALLSSISQVMGGACGVNAAALEGVPPGLVAAGMAARVDGGAVFDSGVAPSVAVSSIHSIYGGGSTAAHWMQPAVFGGMTAAADPLGVLASNVSLAVDAGIAEGTFVGGFGGLDALGSGAVVGGAAGEAVPPSLAEAARMWVATGGSIEALTAAANPEAAGPVGVPLE
jgi:hypothetical protein